MKAAFAFASLAVFTVAANAEILWNNGEWDSMCVGISSEDRPDGLYSEVADDFVLDFDATITDVHWWGSYYNYGVPGRDYRIKFYADDGTGTQPADNPVFEYYAANSECNETFVGQDQYGWDNYGCDLDLGESFSVEAGVKYWLVVQSVDVQGTGGQWGWTGSEPQDMLHESVIRSDYFGIPDWTDISTLGVAAMDQHFYLTGVPAPGALALLGLAGLVSRRRR
jgi:hypothetical protein